jgi:hypothetical protein
MTVDDKPINPYCEIDVSKLVTVRVVFTGPEKLQSRNIELHKSPGVYWAQQGEPVSDTGAWRFHSQDLQEAEKSGDAFVVTRLIPAGTYDFRPHVEWRSDLPQTPRIVSREQTTRELRPGQVNEIRFDLDELIQKTSPLQRGRAATPPTLGARLTSSRPSPTTTTRPVP